MIGKTIFALVLLGILIENEAGCPAIFPQRRNTKAEDFTGNWYMIKAGPKHVGDPTSECFSESYTMRENYVNLVDYTYKRRRAGVWENGEGVAVIKDLSMPGVLDVYGSSGGQSQSLVATDKSTWAIWYACEIVQGQAEEIFMLMSRTQIMSPSVESILTNIIDGYGLADSDMTHINQTNCAN